MSVLKAPLFPISPSPLPSLRQFAEKGKPKHHDRHYHLPKDTSHSASSEVGIECCVVLYLLWMGELSIVENSAFYSMYNCFFFFYPVYS